MQTRTFLNGQFLLVETCKIFPNLHQSVTSVNHNLLEHGRVVLSILPEFRTVLQVIRLRYEEKSLATMIPIGS